MYTHFFLRDCSFIFVKKIMALNSYNITNSLNDMLSFINQLEMKVLSMENEFNDLHNYLDKMSIPRFCNMGNKLTVAGRMDLLASRGEIKFETKEIA